MDENKYIEQVYRKIKEQGIQNAELGAGYIDISVEGAVVFKVDYRGDMFYSSDKHISSIIPNCKVYIGESNNIIVDLPEGTKPTRENPVIITVEDQNGNAQVDVKIIAFGDSDFVEKGKTDVYGKITLPTANDGYTNEEGRVNVNERNVIVSDENGVIPNAYVVYNKDGSISVDLPEDNNISHHNRISVTVLDSIAKPIEGVAVAVKDINEILYTGATDNNGKVFVPPLSEDYTDDIKDTKFIGTIFNSVKYVIWSLIIGLPLPFLCAIMLNEMVVGKSFIRISTYMPAVIPAVAVSLIWTNIYMEGHGGLLNMFLGLFGAEPQQWLMNKNLTIPLIIISMTWQGFGSTILYYFAMIQSVNTELYDAARIDGAGVLSRAKNVIMPHMFKIKKWYVIVSLNKKGV